MAAGLTAALVERGLAHDFTALPPRVVERAKLCVLDWLGVALAGSAEPAVRMLHAELAEHAAGPVTVLGDYPGGLGPADAALVGGVAGHVLDFDDVADAMRGHPSAPVLPALLALAQLRPTGGRELIEAFVAAVETECVLGRLVLPDHYRAGWHATATLGTFGAAMGCARLLRLDPSACANALGLAGAQAAGLKCEFGTMAKPFQVGRAAANGLLAARLAARGFTGATEVLDDPQGFRATHAGGDRGRQGLPEPETGYWLDGVIFKEHASCFLTHSTVDALLALRDEGLVAEQVARIVARVSPEHPSVCGIRRPATPLEAKFSLGFVAALALVRGEVSEATLGQDTVADPVLRDLAGRVEMAVEATMPAHRSETAVHLTDGRVLHREVDMERRDIPAERLRERLAAKFASLAAPVVGATAADEIAAMAGQLDTLSDVAALTRLCGTGERRD